MSAASTIAKGARLCAVFCAVLKVSAAFTNPTLPVSTMRHGGTRRNLMAPLFASISIDEQSQRDVLGMDEWAGLSGVERAEGYVLTSEDGVDFSVMTTQDLAAGSPVLFVPHFMVLSSNEAVQELGRDEATEKMLNSMNGWEEIRHFYLMLKILVEYEKGEESPWYAWLNGMPRYYTNGASMTSFCYECLPPLAAKLALKERANFRALEASAQKVPFLREETKSNIDLLRWAFQIAYTRSFEANDESGDLRIAPMGDMFNHGTETEVALSYDEEGNCLAHTTRDVSAGSPLRMSYGDPTNPSFLLARYGFLDESSPATFCKIMVPHESSQLKEMGYAPNRMLFFKDSGEASEEVFDVLLYQLLASSNAAKKRAFYIAHRDGDHETKQAMHENYWPETATKLQTHIDTFVEELDRLSALGDGKDINDHPRLPLILKHNEFVRNTFLTVRNRYF